MVTVRPVDLLLALADREQVEQRLGRVLVAAVAGVDDRTIDDVGEEPRRARRGVADHDRVGRHRLRGCAPCRRASRPSTRSSPCPKD